MMELHNIIIEPEKMILYESHLVLHGRPFPLKSVEVAIYNIFATLKDQRLQMQTGRRQIVRCGECVHCFCHRYRKYTCKTSFLR